MAEFAKKKKVLMVLSHPEPTSFSHAMVKVAKEEFESQGHEVKVSDLHAIGFDPVNDRRNFKTVCNAERYHQTTEETYAFKNGGFNDQIQEEMDKLVWCDVLLFYSPIHWFSLPAMLKAWVDKVFAYDFCYGGGRWYDVGVFKGKRAMVHMTTGAPDFMYRNDGIQGDIHDILFSVNHGIFFFTGMTALEPYIAYSPSHGTDEDRVKMLEDYRHFVKNFDIAAKPLHFRTLADIKANTGLPWMPEKATQMIVTVNTLFRAWAEGDAAAYKSCIDTHQFALVVSSLRELSGFEAVWAWRQELGAEKLLPHAVDSHNFHDKHELRCYLHVIDPNTGIRQQFSQVVATFDSMDNKIIRLEQEILHQK